MKIIDRFEVLYYQYLDELSQLTEEAPPLATDPDRLLTLYRWMVLVRLFDAKAVALQRTGKLGTYPSTRGQEAVFVGVGNALQSQDVFVPYYRDVGVLIQRGVSLSQILLYWGGDERGNIGAQASQDFPYSVPVGSQPLHAVGVATALKLRHESRAVVTVCGDGATSQGDFYEAMNVAGIWNLPVVFVVCNNQWAISIPRSEQTASHTIAQKAIAAGFQGEQIDGNDVIAVEYRMSEALKAARSGGGPRLLEMVCYRQHDHTTADDASRYEPSHLREEEWKKEPVMRLKKYITQLGIWDELKETQLQEACAIEVDKNVSEYLSMPPQSLVTMIDYLYETLPKAYQEQRDMLVRMEGERHG